MRTETNLLEVVEVSHGFDYSLFDSVSFSLKPQESMSVVGVSGSGKSTLLHICSTLLKPNKGIVKIKNKSIYDLSFSEILDIRRDDIGIVFQSHYLFNGFSAYENIELATLLKENNNLDYRILECLGISDILNQKVSELSGGQQQRVSIARVLSKKPSIIFADEPTGNLDKINAHEVIKILFDYIKNNNASLFLVTHDESLAKMCTYRYLF